MKKSKEILSNKSSDDHHYALLKRQFENFGSEDILNESGQMIAKIRLPFFNPNKNLVLQDVINDKIVLIERRKSFFFRIQEIKDKTNKILCRIRQRKYISLDSKIYIENGNGTKHLTIKGDLHHWNFEIKHISDDESIARVKNLNEENSVAQGLHLDISKYYSIEILKQTMEKILIIGIIISINKLESKFHGVSDTVGIERRIARSRPFGPGNSLN